MGIFSVAMYLLFIFPVLGVVFLPYTVMFLSFVFFDRLIKPVELRSEIHYLTTSKINNRLLDEKIVLPEYLEIEDLDDYTQTAKTEDEYHVKEIQIKENEQQQKRQRKHQWVA
jgi:hypothetical protein